jgi:hypothetical protein
MHARLLQSWQEHNPLPSPQCDRSSPFAGMRACAASIGFGGTRPALSRFKPVTKMNLGLMPVSVIIQSASANITPVKR